MAESIGMDFGRELQVWKQRLEEAREDCEFLEKWEEALKWLSGYSQVDADVGAFSPFAEWSGVLAPFQRRYLTLAELDVARQLQTPPDSPAPSTDAEATDRVAVESHDSNVANTSVRDVLSCPFARGAYDRVGEALNLVDFSACKRFVMIGCGPFPAAVLLVHDRTSVPQIVGVDYSADAVVHADRLVGKFASSRVAIQQADGTRFDYRNADVIYVANHVIGKAEVLRQIAQTAPTGAAVLLRDPCGAGLLFSECGTDGLPAGMRVRSTGADNRQFFSRHVLLGISNIQRVRLTYPV